MFDFLFKKQEVDKSAVFNDLYVKVKDLYNKESIPQKRKDELAKQIEKYGYLPTPHAKALENLKPEEVLFCLEKKLELNGAFKDNKLFIKNNQISPVQRQGYKDADWIKQEQHDIKLINLAALGDGVKDPSPAKFIDWLTQIVILPSGNLEKNILSTTIYLIPFTPRDFGNAYLSASVEEVSSKLADKDLKEVGISGKEQIQLFVALAQLSGHPVIYDIIPQCGRYSKTVMARPEIARWVDVKFLTEEISKALNFVAIKLSQELDEDDVTIVRNIYKTTLKSGSVDLSAEFKPIYDRFTYELEAKISPCFAFTDFPYVRKVAKISG